MTRKQQVLDFFEILRSIMTDSEFYNLCEDIAKDLVNELGAT